LRISFLEAAAVAPLIRLGIDELRVPPLGVGAWSWGDRFFWGYGRTHARGDVEDAFRESVRAGIRLFDTAEVYGLGESERILGQLVRSATERVVVASKYMPWFWRLGPRAVRAHLDASLRRLGLDHIDLYQVHWPPSTMSDRALMNALADAVQSGAIRAIGVSNYGSEHLYRASEALSRRSVPLASNQVEYSLLNRRCEVNGVLMACRDLRVPLIAYSPLAKGLLAGGYGPGRAPGGLRRLRLSARQIRVVPGIRDALVGIGQDHGGKRPSQVALNWLICQRNVVPIPGAKNGSQARENAGALGWSLTSAEVNALDRLTVEWRRQPASGMQA
jgi:aryl-alcohol dehydrogenase-like predicted oxidoreductase